MFPGEEAGGGSPTAGAPRSEPASDGERTITCEACESKLHKSGDVKKKSERLRSLESLEDVNAGLKAENTRLVVENEELKTKIAGLEAEPAPTLAPTSEPGARKHLHLGI